MKTQMPPTSSISSAITVAKIGRPMKKLTMMGSSRWSVGGVGDLALGAAIARGCEGRGRGQRAGRRRPGPHLRAGPDQLQPLDDHRPARFEARFDHAEPPVGERRLDGDDLDLAL